MRIRSRQPVILILLLAAVILLFFVIRGGTRADFGPAVTRCPGPDKYGYECLSGAGFSYIDASNDTRFYEDDGTLELALPFPFLFYGTTYSSVHVSSNGNLQFGGANPAFFNTCLAPSPSSGMGDMMAPYWDDLDIRSYGFLEVEVVGDTPDRIFVVEWDDIPRYGGDSDDRVTFEVQLFEKNNDIVFLYQDVTTLEGYNGSNATIGLQSEAQGSALQYGCLQPVVSDAAGVHFAHPSRPAAQFGLLQPAGGAGSASFSASADRAFPPPKGFVAELIAMLEDGPPKLQLTQLHDRWMRKSPTRILDWVWTDLDSDDLDDLVLIARGGPANPEHDQLLVLEAQRTGPMDLRLQRLLSARRVNRSNTKLHLTADLTHDDIDDVLLWDEANMEASVIAADPDGGFLEHAIPISCHGSVTVADTDEDGRQEIVADDCDGLGRVSFSWNGAEFQSSP